MSQSQVGPVFGWFTQGAESPGNWRIGCQLLLPALACNRNWLRSSVFLHVCVYVSVLYERGLGKKPRYSRAQVFLYQEHNEHVQTCRDRQANGEGLVSESTPVVHLLNPLTTH